MELLRPSSVEELDGGVFLHGGSEVVPLLREGLLEAEQLVDVRGVVPRGIDGGTIGAGTTLAELEVEPAIPDALREACRLAASPQLRNVSSLGGNLLQSTRCWYWRLDYPCRLHGGDRCHARDGEHREHAIFANDFCASAHPSDVAAALVALGARLRTNRRELAIEELYRLPDEGDRRTTTLEDGELLLEVELPPVEASVYLKAMDRKRWSFPQVGVAAARGGRRDPHRARRRGADPVADRERRRSRRRDAAPAHRVEGAARAGARPPRARTARVIAAVVLARGRVVPLRDGTAEAGRVARPRCSPRCAESAVDEIVVVSGAHDLPVESVHCPDWERGPGASLRCGLASLPPEARGRGRRAGRRAQPRSACGRPRRGGLARERRRRGGGDLRRRPPPPRPPRARRWDDVPDEGARVATGPPRRLRRPRRPPGDVDFSRYSSGILSAASFCRSSAGISSVTALRT